MAALGICAEKVVRGADYIDAKASEEEVRERLGLGADQARDRV